MNYIDVFNVENIRSQFPILQTKINNHPLIYLDNAATTHKPYKVIDSISNYYSNYNANINRGLHTLSTITTNNYELTRIAVKKFINADNFNEIIFTKGATEGINIIAQSYGYYNLKYGDEIILSVAEHHSNIVPWQIIAKNIGLKLKFIPLNLNGQLMLDKYKTLLNSKTKIVSITHISNVTGTISPIKEIINMAHKVGAITVIDCAQSVSHININVKDINCDFLVFSAHKMYGPTGVGVLYGKNNILKIMNPYQGGGSMINDVFYDKSKYADIPYKFEAGTPNIAGIIAFKESINFLNDIGINTINKYIRELHNYMYNKLYNIKNIKILGNINDINSQTGILSFYFSNIHHTDISIYLDTKGIAIRSGHHCAMPLMKFYNIIGTCRISLGIYNTKYEIDYCINAINNIIKRICL